MSWSYHKQGRAETVKADAEKHLSQYAESCKRISAESQSLVSFLDAVKGVCDSAKGQAVKVTGSGSAWLEGDKLRSFGFNATIEVIDLE